MRINYIGYVARTRFIGSQHPNSELAKHALEAKEDWINRKLEKRANQRGIGYHKSESNMFSIDFLIFGDRTLLIQLVTEIYMNAGIPAQLNYQKEINDDNKFWFTIIERTMLADSEGKRSSKVKYSESFVLDIERYEIGINQNA